MLAACVATTLTAGELPAVIVSANDPLLGEQVLVTANHGITFPSDKVSARWDEDYYITSASYTANGWAIVMSQTSQWKDQTYKVDVSWPDDWIQQRRNAGYFITSVAADGNNWLIALTRGTGVTDQWAATSYWDFLFENIVNMSADGWMITSLAHNNGLWTVVMSLGTGYASQSYAFARTEEEIAECVRDAREDDRILTTVAADDDHYVLIFSRMKNGSLPEQTVTRAGNSSRTVFKKDIEAGRKVMFIGG